MAFNFEEGDVILCTVDRIIGTNVFVKIDSEKGDVEGTITFSEIAPGRIRNIRDYVTPKKKIVCKVLRISGDRVDLSLRRVTLKEQKELREQEKQEKGYQSILKSVLGDKNEETVREILKEDSLNDFLQRSKEDSKELEKIVGKENSDKIIKILKSQKQKTSSLKKEISLTTTEEDGINIIKSLLSKIKNAEVRYISAGRYSLKIESSDIKKADHELKETIANVEKEAKKSGVRLAVKEN
ncbi:MAG: hypothetical protein Q8P81_00575 [Nanoarchaeota archaeon]|nr:hypothetical protein [Nanoarchaeota archaeon]